VVETLTRRLPILAALLLYGAAPAFAEWAGPDAEEQALVESLLAEKYIHARGQAEKILRKNPASIIARYGMARVYHDEETNLPRALYYIRQAERQLVRRFGSRPTDQQARSWHRRILVEQAGLLGEMDRREEQLRVMDRHDELYRPKMDRWRIWPLMKLHRFEEASKLAEKVSLSEEMNLRISGLNGKIAIESERLRPRRCFRVGLAAVTATSYQSCILNQNTAEAAFAVYKFAEAERLVQRSIQASIQDCPASAYPHLANLYLLRADFQRAMDAIKSSRTAPIERRYRQQFEMSNTAWLARLLYTLGKFEEAQNLTRRVLRAPDRVGMTSFSDEVMRVIYTLDHHAALLALIEDKKEQISARSALSGESFKLMLSLVDLERQAWTARRRIARLLSRTGDLEYLVRPYLKPLPPWHAGALVAAVGNGVVQEAVAEARARETMRRQTAPYFDALDGEIAYRRGQLSRALTLARQALRGLPKDEVLLRGRTSAWAAHSALRLGRTREAARLFDDVLQRFPTALRLLGIPLPAQVRAGPNPLARAVAARLQGSRRLTGGRLGFVVRVTVRGKRVRLCLSGQGGRRHACALADVSDNKLDREGRVARAVDTFHRKVFAPRVDLTQRDINSLDGSSIRGDADDVLREMLGK
jgi:tetratricopeptide (TPR) repeat protein